MKRKIYLAGPIESVKDYGGSWRKRITPELIKMGFEVLDPLADGKTEELGFQEGREFHTYLNDLKNIGNIQELHRVMTLVRDFDLHEHVDKSTDVLVYLPKGTTTCGTWDEMGYAFRKKKTMWLVTESTLEDIPAWAFACVPPSNVFIGLDKFLKQL